MILGESLSFVELRTNWDPNDGLLTEQVWRGTSSSIDQLLGTVAANGMKGVKTERGGYSELVISMPNRTGDNTDEEKPIDKWTIQTDYLQESVWSHPAINGMIHAWGERKGYWTSTPGEVDFPKALADLRQTVENALKGNVLLGGKYQQKYEGNSSPLLPADTDFADEQLSIYEMLLSGQEAFESERISVSRVRTFSVLYAQRMTLLAIPVIYTTAAFIARFLVPAIIQAQLPASPTYAPKNHTWSWKRRKHFSDIDSKGLVTETMDWTFAAWNTLTYELISS